MDKSANEDEAGGVERAHNGGVEVQEMNVGPLRGADAPVAIQVEER